MGNFTEKNIYNFWQNVCIHNTKKKSEVSFVTPHPQTTTFCARFYKPALPTFPRESVGKKGTRAKKDGVAQDSALQGTGDLPVKKTP